MNQYGEAAMAHWRRWLPQRYQAIENPQEFFSTLGERTAQEVDLLADRLAEPDLPGEGYLGKVGRLETAKAQAEERICTELVYLEPEPRVEQDEAPTSGQQWSSLYCRSAQQDLDEANLEHERELEQDYRRRMAAKVTGRQPTDPDSSRTV